MRRVLDSTVDDVHVDGEWVRLTKRVADCVAESDKILLRRYHEEGDLQAREQLIEQ